MYRLTARMIRHLERDLKQYHALFTGGRCQGWEMEELLVRAIRADTGAGHHPMWKEAGHDDQADIRIRTNGMVWPVNVKSGKIRKSRKTGEESLTLSGHRLGRFQEDFGALTDYLNTPAADIIAVPHETRKGCCRAWMRPDGKRRGRTMCRQTTGVCIFPCDHP
ncbi:MAG: hypothetical protein GDA53_05365 [Rhodobacteraceae bacterium]|nr:hypothetical protein [Paracoccaceae bacterium]